MIEQIGRILVDAVRAGLLELILTVAARQHSDTESKVLPPYAAFFTLPWGSMMNFFGDPSSNSR